MELSWEDIQRAIRQGRLRRGPHARERMRALGITVVDLIEAFGQDPRATIIEDYPEDPRGRSCLLLGFVRDQRALVKCCGKVPPAR
jgi:hypothetical protein